MYCAQKRGIPYFEQSECQHLTNAVGSIFISVILYYILNNTLLHHMERNQEMPGLQSLHQVRYISVCYFHQVHTGILDFPNSQFVPHLAMHLQLIVAYDQVLLALPEDHCQFLHHHWCYFL